MKTSTFPVPLRNAALLAIFVAVFLFVIKLYAYKITQSQALFSEAMETVVNIFAAVVSFTVLKFSSKPADRGHPYGHGKIEYLSAGLEGGLIAFAAFLILFESVQAFLTPKDLRDLNWGIALLAGTGIVNYAIGFYLNKVGQKQGSPALEASGRHLMADFWTTVAVVLSLGVVSWTGWQWLDVLIAFVVGLHLIKEGYELVRRSIAGLMDEEQESLIYKILELVNGLRLPGIIQVHHLRVMRSGRYHHIDAHVVVPEFWSVEEAHDHTNDYEKKLFSEYPFPGEIHFHVDPCRRLYCQFCDVQDCPVRKEPFINYRMMNLLELTAKEEPLRGGNQ